jgi:hypothetical protein
VTGRLPLGLSVLALAVAAGCGGEGGGESVAPATWATGFCQALTRFTEGISESGSEMEGEGLPSGDQVVGAVRSAGAASGAFADELRELGPPDVPSGEEVNAALTDAASDAETTFQELEGEVGGEITDATDVAVRARKIAEAAQQALAGIGRATTRLQELDVDGQLANALQAAPECAELGGP